MDHGAHPEHVFVWLLAELGAWAKPFALTGGLAMLGFAVTVSAWRGWWLVPVFALFYGWVFGYWQWHAWTFWLPVMGPLWCPRWSG